MRQEQPRIEESGARVAAVLMGSPDAAGEFCDRRGVSFGCYADPDRSAYRAYSLTTATRKLVTGRSVREGLKLLRRGVATGLPHSGQDVRQMPGTFVVSRGGTLRLAHYNTDPSDNPSMAAVLGALGA